ncbi:MAG: UGMP family protein, partial [Candidatus Thalassarchaeaceae archaeon]|nr:UGMP family protein [Candidatus Thalassarchaeaceae archaeon]
GRLRRMAQKMCIERGGSAHWPDNAYCVDNGTMIAELGRRMHQCGISTRVEDSAINPSLRTDNTSVAWA